VIGCDFVVSATGVEPRSASFLRAVSGSVAPQLSAEGYIRVNKELRTTVADVYAAGDCCQYPTEEVGPGKHLTHHFFQMRLWTQVCRASG
jgi:thioredoxin reductase